MTLNYFLIRVYHLGVLGLTLATASVATLNILQLAWYSHRLVGSFRVPDFLHAIGKILLCCLVLIGVLLLGKMFIHPLGGAIILRITGTVALVVLGVSAYFFSANLLGLSDLQLLVRRGDRKVD
jgi:peptidoglycan biosynthesis protein MviN/MurJ (putative lipid II flippase)